MMYGQANIKLSRINCGTEVIFQGSNIRYGLTSAVTLRKSPCPTPSDHSQFVLSTALLSNKSREFLFLLQQCFSHFYPPFEMSVTFTIYTMCDIDKDTKESVTRVAEMWFQPHDLLRNSKLNKVPNTCNNFGVLKIANL